MVKWNEIIPWCFIKHVGGTVAVRVSPKEQFWMKFARHVAWTQARHHKHLQSCNLIITFVKHNLRWNIVKKLYFWLINCKKFIYLITDPQVLSQTAHLDATGKFPSIHWWCMWLTPWKSTYLKIITFFLNWWIVNYISIFIQWGKINYIYPGDARFIDRA